MTSCRPTPSLDRLPFESDRVYELFLGRDHFVEVFIRIPIERGLNPRVPEDSLHRLRVLFSLVGKPIRQAGGVGYADPTDARRG
jgi:hypothetical protein